MTRSGGFSVCPAAADGASLAAVGVPCCAAILGLSVSFMLDQIATPKSLTFVGSSSRRP